MTLFLAERTRAWLLERGEQVTGPVLAEWKVTSTLVGPETTAERVVLTDTSASIPVGAPRHLDLLPLRGTARWMVPILLRGVRWLQSRAIDTRVFAKDTLGALEAILQQLEIHKAAPAQLLEHKALAGQHERPVQQLWAIETAHRLGCALAGLKFLLIFFVAQTDLVPTTLGQRQIVLVGDQLVDHVARAHELLVRLQRRGSSTHAL